MRGSGRIAGLRLFAVEPEARFLCDELGSVGRVLGCGETQGRVCPHLAVPINCDQCESTTTRVAALTEHRNARDEMKRRRCPRQALVRLEGILGSSRQPLLFLRRHLYLNDRRFPADAAS